MQAYAFAIHIDAAHTAGINERWVDGALHSEMPASRECQNDVFAEMAQWDNVDYNTHNTAYNIILVDDFSFWHTGI